MGDVEASAGDLRDKSKKRSFEEKEKELPTYSVQTDLRPREDWDVPAIQEPSFEVSVHQRKTKRESKETPYSFFSHLHMSGLSPPSLFLPDKYTRTLARRG